MSLIRNSYFLAILFHAALFAGLAIYTSAPTITRAKSDQQVSSATAANTSEAAQFTASNPPFSMTQVVSQISASLVSASNMSPGEQFEAAGNFANRLESISSVTSMKEMGSYLRSSVSWKPPASRAERGKEKVFDHATSMPVGAKQKYDGRYVSFSKTPTTTSANCLSRPKASEPPRRWRSSTARTSFAN